MNLATLDIVLLALIAISALIGLMRGLFKEVISLAAWAAALILGLYFAPELALRIDFGPEGSTELVLAFAIIFIGTLIVGALVQWLMSKLVESTGLSGTDRFLGFLFGAARGALVCTVALIALRPFAEHENWWLDSRIRAELMIFETDVLVFVDKAVDEVTDLTDTGVK
ncbi:MAG: CvpA family protein [Proteobacteria bacterium]|nr:CvpA family protein [Pseudomonadota bacterium]